jgi:hypothetical protein
MAFTESPKAAARTDEPKTTSSAAAPATDRAANPGESTDPEVQRLLAIKQGHQMNRDLVDPPVVDEKGLEAIDAAIDEVDDLLADLGYPQESQADRKARLEKDAKDAADKEKAAAKRRTDRAEAREKAADGK